MHITINYHCDRGSEGGVPPYYEKSTRGGGRLFREGFLEDVTFKWKSKDCGAVTGRGGGGASQADGSICAKALRQGRASM